jgi:hypothetical protein
MTRTEHAWLGALELLLPRLGLYIFNCFLLHFYCLIFPDATTGCDPYGYTDIFVTFTRMEKAQYDHDLSARGPSPLPRETPPPPSAPIRQDIH